MSTRADDEIVRGIAAHDPSVWSSDPRIQAQIGHSLGWLDAPLKARHELHDLVAFARQVQGEGYTDAVVLGMGGSSLAPDVMARILGTGESGLRLHVLDSTHPEQVRSLRDGLDARRTLFLVSSKSGTTSEPNAFFAYFWEVLAGASNRPAHFVAITDPGTPLESLARSHHFRRVFAGTPDIGGRYSALSNFGLVPAALMGADLDALIAGAEARRRACLVSAGDNPGYRLGTFMGEGARAGRDKVTIITDSALAAFGDWAEQLLAESTGKEGKGLVPVAREPLADPQQYGPDRQFTAVTIGSGGASIEGRLARLEAAGFPVLRMTLERPEDLGGLFYEWEFATALAGRILQINPFDQPNVEESKERTRTILKSGPQGTGRVTPVTGDALVEAVRSMLANVHPPDYVAMLAYLAPSPAVQRALALVRTAVFGHVRAATTLGLGPRFLHSTGQLHKGGPNEGVFLVFTDDATPDEAIPGEPYGFGGLIHAQAQGDVGALTDRGRRVVTLPLGADAATALEGLASALNR